MHDFAALKRDALVRTLRRHLRGEVRFDDTSRRLYSTDASIYQVLPLGVVVPKTADDLVATVRSLPRWRCRSCRAAAARRCRGSRSAPAS